MNIPYRSLCGSQQIGKFNLFKLSSRISFSPSSNSSLSSSSERMLANLKDHNTLTILLTPEFENMNVDCTLNIF